MNMTAAAFSAEQRAKLAKSGVAMPDGSFPIRNRTDLSNAIQALGRAKNPGSAKAHIKNRARALGATDVLPADWMTAAASQEDETQAEDNARYSKTLCPDCDSEMTAGACTACGYMHPEGMTASAAGLAPLKPPAEWFFTEEPDEPTPLTVTADGRIFGHAALYDSCHTAFPGRCRRPPLSPSGYSLFHLGAVETAEGEQVPVGKITMSTGHASMIASQQQALAHYDNTGTTAAYVRARDGKLGIWVSGAARPDAPAEQVAALRGSSVSGDWRAPRPGAPMEMIGLLAVNVPGFPVPRPQALLASGYDENDEMALVAAGVFYEEPLTDEQAERKLAMLIRRAEGLDALCASVLPRDFPAAR